MTARTGRAVVLLIALGAAVAGCGGEPGRTSSPAVSSPAPPSTTPPSATSPSAGSPAGTSPPPRSRDLVAGRYQPLWPFADAAAAEAWRSRHREDGAGAWHLDPARTAVRFARDHLGFSEIDRAVKTNLDGVHARVHVGLAAEEGPRPMVAAVVHLVRYGEGEDAPWEVVGTDDTTFSLTTPEYGASVGSPMTVGGRITGVDESIRVQVRRPGGGKALGEHCCVGAGGEKSPWSARLTFRPAPGTTLTVVASTGGHVAEVERFAVTGVTVP